VPVGMHFSECQISRLGVFPMKFGLFCGARVSGAAVSSATGDMSGGSQRASLS